MKIIIQVETNINENDKQIIIQEITSRIYELLVSYETTVSIRQEVPDLPDKK